MSLSHFNLFAYSLARKDPVVSLAALPYLSYDCRRVYSAQYERAPGPQSDSPCGINNQEYGVLVDRSNGAREGRS